MLALDHNLSVPSFLYILSFVYLFILIFIYSEGCSDCISHEVVKRIKRILCPNLVFAYYVGAQYRTFTTETGCLFFNRLLIIFLHML